MEAIVNVKNIGISTKKSIEIANLIKYKNIEDAKKILQRVIDKKQLVPYKRHNKDVPHKPGMMAGKYPIKTCKFILYLLNSLTLNAQNKGLSSNLFISEIIVNRGTKQVHYGRHLRRKMKRTHLKIIAKEIRAWENKND